MVSSAYKQLKKLQDSLPDPADIMTQQGKQQYIAERNKGLSLSLPTDIPNDLDETWA